MSRPEDAITPELEELTAAACDGQLSDRETERLEELLVGSAEARRYYLLYLHLHGELHWQQAAGAEQPARAAGDGRGMRLPTPVIARPGPERISRLRLIGFLICAAVAITLLVFACRALPQRKRGPSPAPPVALATAKLSGAVRPRWQPGSAPPSIGQAVPLDRRLVLERGVIEIAHGPESRILIEAPAAFRYLPGNRIEFESGLATVLVSGEPDFLIEVGGVTVEPLEGAFGLSADGDATELHSLEGKVRISRVGSEANSLNVEETELEGGEALKWSADSSEPPQPVTVVPGRFARALPDLASRHSVATMRSLVANHPHLIHQYPFEGTSRLEKCRDARGTLHLTEAVMVGGRGRGALIYTAPGLDLTTEAIRPHREPEGGNENGVALQTEVRFRPPKAMTIELLLRYRVPADANDETVALAVATRDADRDCGFYVAAVGQGHLSLLLDGEADWVEMDTILVPEHWYYVAMAFVAGEEDTTVNAFVVDLEGRERELRHVLRDETVPGTPAVSRLGVGKGFDYTGAHAYPWPGELDEVSIYDAALDVKELQTHVDALRANGSGLE